MDDRFIWIDIETFGLDAQRDPIIEVGVIVTNLKLQPIGEFHCLFWSEMHEARYQRLLDHSRAGNLLAEQQLILTMHSESGLWQDAREQWIESHDAEAALDAFLVSIAVDKTDPLCGSSVQFDRAMLAAQMPHIEEMFSYRNIDISSVRELCRRVNPEMYAGLDEDVKPTKLHRALSDLDDTLRQAAWYFDNFLWIGPEASVHSDGVM